MAFNVKNDDADRLLRELTSVTGETLTETVSAALRERLDRQRRIRSSSRSTRTRSRTRCPTRRVQ